MKASGKLIGPLPPAVSAAAIAACALALAACGSSTKTVSVREASGQPGANGSASGGGAGRSATAPRPGTAQPSGGANGAPGASGQPRTAPEPEFTQHEAKAEGLGAASAVLRAKGFTPANTSDYHSAQALRVLIGTRTGSGDGYGQQAFFFVNGRYIGTDATAPSAALRVVGQGDTEVTLSYPLYRLRDPLCCPGGGQARVRFQLNNGRLLALDPIPPVNSGTRSGRR